MNLIEQCSFITDYSLIWPVIALTCLAILLNNLRLKRKRIESGEMQSQCILIGVGIFMSLVYFVGGISSILTIIACILRLFLWFVGAK